TDPVAAFDALIQGMGRVQAGGGDLAAELDRLGLEGTQNLQVLLRMAGAGDILTESLARASEEWAESNALLEEAAKRYETTEGQIELARNQLRDAAIDIGGTLVPAVAAVVGTGADLIQFWRDLPGPVKDATALLATAGAAVALFSGATLIAIPRIAAFNAALAGLEAGALRTVGTRLAAMGSMLAGPWGIALLAGITAVGIFGAKQGAAARQIDAVKATLDDQTGMLTANSRAWAVNFLADEGMLARAKDLGVELSLVTDAALGNADALSALEAMQGELEASIQAATEASDGDTQAKIQATQADTQRLQSLTRLIKVLTDTNGVVADAREEWELEQDAMGKATDASGKATDGQQRLTGAWQGGADAAGELGEEVRTLGEDLEDLSSNYLDNRAAGRAIRDQLREIRRATAEYREEHGSLAGAFARGTESGDGFASMLDSLAQDYQRQIAATEKLTGSEDAVMRTYRQSREALKEVAKQLGMTEEAAKRYVNEVLGAPEIVRTRFETPGLDAALNAALNLRSAIDAIPRGLHASSLTPAPASPQPKKKEDGGVVTAYASGGFSFGSRTGVAREPMIARGGANILWAEPATGWEAYISGKPGMETRNRDVWAEAGRRLGMTTAGATIVERVVERPLSGQLRLSGPVELIVDGRPIRGMMRGEAVAVLDARDAGRGVRGRMNGWSD
ncbi:MAG: phage tail tape measure protein, partial [Nocardioides sp.]